MRGASNRAWTKNTAELNGVGGQATLYCEYKAHS